MTDIAKVVQDLGQAFEEFKKTNDQALAQKAATGHVDTLLEQKLSNINKSIDELTSLKSRLDAMESKAQKAAIAGATGETDPVKAEHKAAFANFMRKGDVNGLAELQRKALNTGVGEDGGFAVPEVIDSMVHQLLIEVSPMRAISNVVNISTSDYKKLVSKRGANSGWVGETDTRDNTNTPKLAEVTPFMGELYANPQVTQAMLEDAFFNVEQWLAGEVSDEFSVQEGSAFVSGDGMKKPKGFLAYANSLDIDGVRAFGTLQAVESGVAGAIGGFEKLIDLVHSLKAGHRAGAVFTINKEALAVVRKLKDNDGQYLWQPSLQAGVPGQLLGYDVVEMEDMPAIAAGATPIAFGNFRAGYTIVDRVGVSVLRNPYRNPGFVEFYTRKRVGGMVVDSEAIKLLKVSA